MKYGDDLSYRVLLTILVWEKKTLFKILKDKERYSEILEVLNRYDIDDYGPLPKQKDLLKMLDLGRKELMTLMREMYESHRAFLICFRDYFFFRKGGTTTAKNIMNFAPYLVKV